MLVDLLFAAVAAASTPTTSTAEPAQQPPETEKMICKSQTFVGSHVPKRICMTRAQWEEGRRRAQEHLDNFRNRGVDAKTLFPKGPG